MQDPLPFDPVGDAPVEARIVAWVLGEASVFEAAELERLCDERPELLVFRRRMRALHGLLTEAEAAEPDHSWKLPPEKRRLLDEIFGEEKVVRLAPVMKRGRRLLLAAAACVVLGICAIGLIGPIGRIGPIDYSETASKPAPETKTNPTLTPQALDQAIRDQEDKVEERRKVLATIVRTNGITYNGKDSYYGEPGVEDDKMARSALEAHNRVQEEKMILQSQIKSLQKYDADQLMVYAAGLDLPDNTIRDLYPQYLDKKRELAALKAQGAADAHPALEEKGKEVEGMKRQLDESVINLRSGLQVQLEMAEDRMKNVQVMKDDTREEAIKRGLDAQDYSEAKREFESDQQLLQQLKLRKIEQTIASKVSEQTLAMKGKEAAPPAPAEQSGDVTYKLDSAALVKNRDPGLQESARQSQIARKTDQRRTAAAKGFGSDFPLPMTEAIASIPRESVDSPSRADARFAGENVRRLLYLAEGSVNLGKYDDSKKAYEEVLKSDPNNIAARKGLEKIEVAKSDYFRSSTDNTRAELLSQVENAWELSVPADKESLDQTKSQDAGAVMNSIGDISPDNAKKLDELILRYETELKADPENEDARNALQRFTAARSNMLLMSKDETLIGESTAQEAKPLVERMEEIPATENPYSTFSLNISDASFQLAKAALAKGERPDPASIKPEQFYNAVDYGDPAPTADEPVAATVEQSAHPIIPGRNLFRVAIRTGSAGRSAVQSLRLTLLVDQSGSMVREDRRASMEHALSQLAVLLTKADLVTVIGFSRTPRLLADGMKGDQSAKLSGLVNQTASEGGTNLEEAMRLAGEKAVEHRLAGAQNRIVLFTDGAANLGDANPQRLAEQVKSFRQQGLAFDVAGIGADGLNDRLLSELARNGNGRYYVVGNEQNDSFARQLAGAFRPAAENVKVQVNFNPQRVGKYRLIGFEKDRLKTEDFRNDAVDAAELAADEAGVAIYQVEPLIGGSGEIGEVSVRFRDAASEEMVERAWTIPYDSQASAFDRATPSMQLAGLSLLAAEELKGGPMADAIDFKQLNGSSAFVKQFYGSSPRVGEMLRVIDALK